MAQHDAGGSTLLAHAGAYGSGVFKSTDGGTTWSTVSAGLTNLHVSALAIDPQTDHPRHQPSRRHHFPLGGPHPLEVQQRRRRHPHPLRHHHPVIVLRHLHAPDGHLPHQALATASRAARPQLVPIDGHHPIRRPRPPVDRLAPPRLPIERCHHPPLLG